MPKFKDMVEANPLEAIRLKIREMGYHDGHIETYRTLTNDIPIIKKMDGIFTRDICIGRVRVEENVVDVYGREHVGVMTELATWLEETFEKEMTVELKLEEPKKMSFSVL